MMKITQKELQKMEDEVMHNVTPWSNHTRMRKIQGCACVDCTIEVDLKELIDITYWREINNVCVSAFCWYVWLQAPRRNCCRVMKSNKTGILKIEVAVCRDGEFSEPA